MIVAEQHLTAPVSDPAPATPSDASIQKAQALREAIRRKLLNRPEPQANPYWAVGAD